MHRPVRNRVLIALGLALALSGWAGWAGAALAQNGAAQNGVAQNGIDPNAPLAVISVAGMDELLGDVQFAADLMQAPEAAGAIAMARPVLQAVDGTRPMGLLIYLRGRDPRGIAFVPVRDFAGLLDKIESRFGRAEDTGRGIRKFTFNEQVFFKQQGDLVYIADSRHHLLQLPQDPQPLLDGLHRDYDIAIKLFAQNASSEMRDQIRDQLQDLIREVEGSGADPIQVANLRILLEALDQLEAVTMGIALDRNQGRMWADVEVTAVANSPLAEKLRILDQQRSRFAGFLNDQAAASFIMTGRMRDPSLQQATAGLTVIKQQAYQGIDNDDNIEGPQAKAAFKKIVERVIGVIEKTIEAGQFDSAGMIKLEPGSLQVVAGMQIADGRQLETAFREFVKLVENEPDVPEVKFDVAEHDGVKFHSLQLPLPDHEQEARGLFGSNLSVILGVGEDRLFLAFGRDGISLLKDVIDASARRADEPVPTAQVTIALLPFLRYLSTLERESDFDLKQFVLAVEPMAGRDHVQLQLRPVPNGIRYRVELEEGVLQMLGEAVKLSRAQAQ